MRSEFDRRVVPDEVLTLIRACQERVPCRLIGGAALSGAYLAHRRSRDVDLVWERTPDIEPPERVLEGIALASLPASPNARRVLLACVLIRGEEMSAACGQPRTEVAKVSSSSAGHRVAANGSASRSMRESVRAASAVLRLRHR